MQVFPWRATPLLLTFALAGSGGVWAQPAPRQSMPFRAIEIPLPPFTPMAPAPWAPPAQATPEPPARALPPGGAGAPSAGREGQMWLSFVNTEIAVVARSLAAMTGRQVLVDARVMGNITLQSSQAVTPEQAWTLFTQVLQDRKIGITISQGMHVIAPRGASARPVELADLPGAARAEAKPVPVVPQAEISVEWARPPRPTLPNPSGPMAAARIPAQEPVAVWSLLTQDKTLYHSLSRWAQLANWQLMWEADRDFPIQAQISIEGNFTSAMQLVMNSLASTDYPLQAVMNDSTRVISIIRHQDPFAR